MSKVSLTAEGARFTYDDDIEDEALGQVEFDSGAYGPTISINGREIGYIDLFPASADGGDCPIQVLIFDEERHDEPLCKLNLLKSGKIAVIVHPEAERLGPGSVEKEGVTGLYSDGRDRVYCFPDREEGA